MKKILIALTLLMSVAMCRALPLLEEGEAEDPSISETRRLKAEISLLNLLNGLYLSNDQLDKLIALGDRAEAVERRALKDFVADSAPYLSGLKSLRDSLYTPTGSAPELKKAAQEAEVKHVMGPRDVMAEESGRLEEEARGVLSEAQVAVVEGFKPCLIPPKTLSDPVAVGQLTTTDKEEAALDVMRRMPEDLYQKRRQEVVRIVLDRGEREKGKMPADVRRGMEGTLLKKLDEARSLSDADFGLKKKDYAKEFQLFDETVVYHHGHKRELGKIHRFLLSGGAARTLRRYKDAVAKAPARTQGEAPVGEDPADQKAKARRGAMMRFGGATMQAIKEYMDSGKLAKSEAQRLRQELKALKESNDQDKQYAGVSRIAARLASLGVTPKLVDGAYGRLAYLCHKKCLPPGPLLRPKGASKKGRPAKQGSADITGLGAMVAQARDYEDSGSLPLAYRTLSQVASYLERFKE